LLCDAQGNILSGETILGVIAIDLQRMNQLKERKIVTTPMSNRGLESALEKYGIGVDYADVGDRNIAEKICALGCNFGGESSGHVIFMDRAPTSDGIQTALLFFEAVVNLGISLQEAVGLVPLLPKKISNIVVKNKISLEELPDLQDTIALLESSLGEKGKIFVRYSGTEYKLRLLVEAETKGLADKVMEKLKNSIENYKKIV
jgi:phosphoglucosamine mutase